MPDNVFGCSAVLVVVVQESVLQGRTRVIEQDTCNEKENALRVPRAVNIGWRFTARMQVHSLCRLHCFRIDFWWRTTFCMTPKNRDFHENLIFLENRRDASRKPPGCPEIIQESVRISRSDFMTINLLPRILKISRFLWLIGRMSIAYAGEVQYMHSAVRGLYESSRAVNNGWRFTARNKLW